MDNVTENMQGECICTIIDRRDAENAELTQRVKRENHRGRRVIMNTGEIVRLKNVVSDRDHVLGPQSAPVTLVQYGNFECIHCGRVFPVLKQVQKLLGNNLRFVFRHFPTVRTHPHSLRAAEAAEAAGAQERFWAMHDELFMHQQALEDAQLSHYARRIGLDVERFARDMSKNVFRKQIEADYERSLDDEHVTAHRRSTSMRCVTVARRISTAF